MVHHRGSLYVGAPLAGYGGKVFKCDQLTSASTPLSCESLTSPILKNGSWFGGSLAASSSNLYSCAFRYSWQDYVANNQQVWKCFSLSWSKKWTTLLDFTQPNFPRLPQSPWTWYRKGFYGFSSTVDDVGDLGNSTFLIF